MESYLRFVAAYSKSILVSLGLITVFFIFQIPNLTQDSNPYLLSDSHPARKSLFDLRKDFTGTYDAVLIAFFNPSNIFNQNSLNAIFTLTNQSRQLMFASDEDIQYLTRIRDRYVQFSEVSALIDTILAGGFDQNDARVAKELSLHASVKEMTKSEQDFLRYLPERLSPIAEMAGLAATENLLMENDFLRAYNTLNSLDSDPETVRAAVVGNDMMTTGVVSKDEKVSLLTVELTLKQEDAEGQLRAYQAFQSLISDYRARHPEFTDEVFIAGIPAFFAEQKQILDRDMGLLFPLVIVIVAVALWVCFQTTLGVLLPMVNVIMCTIWTLGAMAIFRVPLDLITSVLPIFLITICSSDAVHVMAEYYQQKRLGLRQQPAVSETLRLMISPVILTTLTTCATYIISTWTNITNIRSFGWFISFGMFVALVISLLLIPAWLYLLKSENTGDRLEKIKNKRKIFAVIEKQFIALFSSILSNRKKVTLGFVIVFSTALLLAFNIHIDDKGVAYFKPDNMFRQADTFINENAAGTSPGWIAIDTQQENGALTLEYVKFIDQLERFINDQQHVNFSYSLAKYIKRINYVMNDEKPEFNRLPKVLETIDFLDHNGSFHQEQVSGDDLVRQSILLYENGGGSDLTNVLNDDFSSSAILFSINTTRSSDYQSLMHELNSWLEKELPPELTVTIAGTPIIWTGVLKELLDGQIKSIILAFATVLIVMSLWFRSFRLGLAGSLPLAATVVFYYALMTLLGIELNIGTALISFLVLGIVDYSVHYLLRIRHYQFKGFVLDEAIIHALENSGRSILINIIVFSFGFTALLFSDYQPIIDLGALVGITLLLSGFMSLFLITLFSPWLLKDPVVALERSGSLSKIASTPV